MGKKLFSSVCGWKGSARDALTGRLCFRSASPARLSGGGFFSFSSFQARQERRRKATQARCFISMHFLFFLPSGLWILPGGEDESRPPPASSWQPAEAGPAWWDALLGLGGCWSSLLLLPQSVPLEWDGGRSVEQLAWSGGYLFPPSHRLQLLGFFIRAFEVGWFFSGGWGLSCGLGYFPQSGPAFWSFLGAVRMRWRPGGSCVSGAGFLLARCFEVRGWRFLIRWQAEAGLWSAGLRASEVAAAPRSPGALLRWCC